MNTRRQTALISVWLSTFPLGGHALPAPLSPQGQVPASVYDVRAQARDTTNRAQPDVAAAFDLSLPGNKVAVISGNRISLTVNVTRRAGFRGAIALTVTGLPTGVSVSPVTVGADQTKATLTLNAAANAPHSFPTTVTVGGKSEGQTAARPLTVTVRGPAGSLDTTFGSQGSRSVDFGGRDDYATALTVQPDGKMLLAGYTPGASGEGINFALTRLDREGNLDSTFGKGGRVQVNFGPGNDQAYALAVQPGGQIVVAGFADVARNRDFALARLNANGTPDTSFGTGGRVTTAIGSAEDRAYALALQKDGKIVLGGTSNSGGPTGLDFALVRYLPNGQLDAAFGSGGKVVTAVATGSASDAVYALALQDGAIVAAGGEGDFMVARYTAEGKLDSSFSGDGKISGLFGSSVGHVRALQIVKDGGTTKLLLAGNASNDTAAVRLNADGTPDPSFASGGRFTLKVSPTGWDEATALATQPDGKIVLGGWSQDETATGNFAVVRLSAAGQPDTSFGRNGIVVTPLAPNGKNDHARALALQPDDRVPAVRVVVAGERVPSFSDFAAARYWP